MDLGNIAVTLIALIMAIATLDFGAAKVLLGSFDNTGVTHVNVNQPFETEVSSAVDSSDTLNLPPLDREFTCKDNSNDVYDAIRKYNHCNVAEDCVVVTGTRCGFQSGLLTNKNEVENVLPAINSCASQGCFEDTFGAVGSIQCIDHRCAYSR